MRQHLFLEHSPGLGVVRSGFFHHRLQNTGWHSARTRILLSGLNHHRDLKYSRDRRTQTSAAFWMPASGNRFRRGTVLLVRLPARRRGQHEVKKSVQVEDRSIRRDAQLLTRLTGTVDPHRGITERLGTSCVPSAKRREDNILLRQPEFLHAQPIRTRIGLVGAVRIGADQGVEERNQVRASSVMCEKST